MTECNNTSATHDPFVLHDDRNALRVFCKTCKKQERIGKDRHGNPENKLYIEWFKRDSLQPNSNLYYKYNEDKMSIV